MILRLILCALLVGSASAQVPSDTLTHYTMEEIVISADGAVERSRSASTVHRVALAGIAQTDAASIDQVLRLIPAARVQTNSRGESLVYIRGSGERQISLFFDGALLNVPWDNRVDLSLIPSEVVGDITVAKGVPSVLYGPNVLGGAIDMASRELRAPGAYLQLSGITGSYGTSQSRLTWLRRGNRFRTTVFGGLSRSDGTGIPGDAVLPYSQTEGSLRTNTDRDMPSVFAQGAFESESGVSVGLSLLRFGGRKGVAPEGHLDPARARVRYWRYPDWATNMVIISSQVPLGTGNVRGAMWVSRFGQRIDKFEDHSYRSQVESQEDEDDTFSDRITGRTVAEDISDPNTNEVIIARDMLISRQIADKIEAVGVTSLRIRSALTCEAAHGVCALCYGTDLTTGQLVDMGEAIGIIAAQSIGEPGTQLTMRTFHTGGTVSGGGFQSRIEARHDGVVKYHSVRFVEHPVQVDDTSLDKSTTNGQPEIEKIVLSRNAQLRIVDENGRVIERHDAQIGARLCVDEGQRVTKGDPHAEEQTPSLLLEWDPYRVPILTEYQGKAVFQDIVEGRTMREDKATGLAERVIIEYKGEDQPRIEIYSDNEELLASYLMPTGAHLSVTDEEMVTPGTVLARLPRETAKSRDIVTGLPRVTELFEARRPRDAGIIAEIEGHVKLEGINRGMRQLRIVHTDVSSRPYRIPMGKHLIVHDGDLVEAGERVTDGPINPHDILEVKGEEAVQSYLVNEVQEVYRTQGERINDKHIEVIIRRMLNKVRITSPGSTEFLEDDEVDRSTFNRVNRHAMSEDGQPAMAEPILQGITKAALSTESFISAASFQQTTNVLTKATVVGKRDYLKGLKENVIMGRLIPAGTGVSQFRKIEILPRTEPESPMPQTDSPILSLDEQAAD